MLRTWIKPAYLWARQLVVKSFVHSDRTAGLPTKVATLLVITDGRLGDVCLTTPVLKCLRDHYPQAHLAVILPSHLHPLVQRTCNTDAVFDPSSKLWLGRSWDLAIDLSTDYYLRPAQIAFHSHAPIRIGFDISGRGMYFTHPLAAPSLSEHAQETYTRVLALLGIPFRKFGDAPRLSALQEIREASPNSPVAVHPGAHHPTQRWPAENFAALIHKIRRSGQSVVVLGATREKSLISKILGSSGVDAETAISDDVMALAQLIQQSQLLICNNSGPLHLAGLFGTPTLSFMGPTVQSRWWPLGEHSVVLRRDDLPCIGCNLGYCKIGTHACMTEIRPDEVFAAYLKLQENLLTSQRA